MNNATRAPVGGIVGVNGEFYEGGKFLPSNARRAKQAPVKFPKGGRCEIAPYVWELRPADGLCPIFGTFKFCVDGWHLKNTGVARIHPELVGVPFVVERQAGIDAAIAKFNAGERWSVSC